ncbi:probable ATP-dependent RNA helicase DDX31 [Esox lucius]|uniref:ATP-dependent RNA helicase n=1 Tax=Esox lucius TaxID=8010 RepID=A0A3P8XX93_ESOLU|nr:probable ATP-dependent RNA helicase DDX31 [Esox lucius]XP_010898398.2 probable ATP-dependent RNA helicase DDX31 [Esox lucius]
MAEDTLMLNLRSDSVPYFQRPATSKEKWASKKAQKRKSSGIQVAPSKRGFYSFEKDPKTKDILSHEDTEEENEQTNQVTVSKPAPKAAAKALSSEISKPAQSNQTQPKSKSKHVGEHKGDDRAFIKTSSLFKNNPDIPDVHRPAVTQLKEKVFTSDSFAEQDLHPHLVATLTKVLNVTSMTSVQKETIPVLLSGRDAVVRSQTGSGKTLAYGIPLVQSLQAVEPKIKRGDGPLAVIVVPTRELAQQSFQIFQKLLKPFTWIVPGVLMGGEKRKAEKARLRKGINILITTPGRLVDHIKNTLSIAFSAVRWLILDEADRILDLGFEKDLMVILNSLNSTGPPRQNVLLSATLTDGLSRLAGICMKEPVSIHVGENAVLSSKSTPNPDTAQGQPDSFAVPERLQQHMVVVPSKLRLVCLAAFLLSKCKFEKDHKIIVFVSSCEAVEFLLTLFNAVLCGPKAKQQPLLSFFRLHGNMKQEERTEVFHDFAVCKTGILLCTDVAARGLDLPQVTWIVQFNPPSTPAEYVHRVGRTARIGEKGSSLLFLTPAETAYVTSLANHNISISEMKLETILSTLMLDDRFTVRGKYDSKKSSGALEQEVRERATVLQTEFENFVHADDNSVQVAKRALQSFLRAYTAYPSSMKHIFHIKTLHLGHAAKSFGLRDAPQGLVSSGNGSNKDRGQTKNKDKRPPMKKLSAKEREASLMRSEYACGIDGNSKKKKRKKKTHAEGEEDSID